MSNQDFFFDNVSISLNEIAKIAGVSLPEGVDGEKRFSSVAPLETAGPNDVAYMDNARYGNALEETSAGVCLVSSRFSSRVPAGTFALVLNDPYRVFAQILAHIYPTAVRPSALFSTAGVSPGAIVHPSACLEDGVAVDPGAVIGPCVKIESGTFVGANAVIGAGVRIGRDCAIGPNVSLSHALVGNRVIVHPGARIGQDGFGFSMGAGGHLKVPQVGRVLIHDDVEIGANTTIDRGASRDTIIGEGTKIDNLVQIGHNVVVGRHCVIVSQVGISGSTTLEDFVVLGGQVGIAGHLNIGAGSQLAASSGVATDVPAGVTWGGTPAKPIREWFREVAWLKKMVHCKPGGRRDSAK